MDEKLYEDIKSVVARIFSEKEESEKVAQTEEALREAADTIAELTDTLEKRNDELSSSEEKAKEVEEQNLAAETELEAARKDAEDLRKKLEETEASLEDIKKDRLAENRMTEITEAGIAASDVESQSAKVREMSDEEFAAYTKELVSIREAVVAELEKNKEDKVIEKTEEEIAAEEKAKAEEEAAAAAALEEEGTPPANVDAGKAVSAALNLETRPSKDMVAKYAELGKALAEQMTK